jgi:hypothetical protein
MIRELLTENEKNYIKEKIINPMIPDMEKSTLFNNVDRATIMLETSLRRIMTDHNFSARVVFMPSSANSKDLLCVLDVKHKECNEVLSYRVPIKIGR